MSSGKDSVSTETSSSLIRLDAEREEQWISLLGLLLSNGFAAGSPLMPSSNFDCAWLIMLEHVDLCSGI